MTSSLLAACAALLVACGGGSKPSSTTTATKTAKEACTPTDCGAEPPLSPSVCPTGESVSTVCERATSGACERHILCNGSPRADDVAPQP